MITALYKYLLIYLFANLMSKVLSSY